MSSLFKWTLIIFLVLSIPVSVISMIGLFAINAGVATLSMGIAILYFGLVAFLLRLTPLWPKGLGMGYVAASASWGVLVCVAMALVAGLPWFAITGAIGWEDAAASFGGAYPEEIAKTLGVVVILFLFRQLNRPWHGLVTGALVGLAFEAYENFMYAISMAQMDPESDLRGALGMWGLRLVAGPLMHSIWTAMAGWAVALALFSVERSTAWRWGVGFGGFMVAFLLHFLWNYGMDDMRMMIITLIIAVVIQYPLIIWLFIHSWLKARRDDSYSYTSGAITSLAALTQR